jgi:hypothetical protein
LATTGQRIRHIPYLSPASRAALFAALRAVHADLVAPPASVAGDARRLAEWQPPCLADVDWRALEASAARMADGGGGAPEPDEAAPPPPPPHGAQKAQQNAAATGQAPTLERQRPTRAKQWLTVGLIGEFLATHSEHTPDAGVQPQLTTPPPPLPPLSNANRTAKCRQELAAQRALRRQGEASPFAPVRGAAGQKGAERFCHPPPLPPFLPVAQVVRASKTPGKTKHFQTHFIGRTLQLQDSPGLVFPSYAGMETCVVVCHSCLAPFRRGCGPWKTDT